MKLIDFGLAMQQETVEATVRTPDTPSQTPREYAIVGTIDFAAPEQMGRLPGVPAGTHSDVYGFGKICYFALLGTPEPDDVEKDSLDERWRKLLSLCTARKVEGRLKDVAAVLERVRDLEATPPTGSRPAASPVARPRPVVSPVRDPLPPLEIPPTVTPPPRGKTAGPVPPRYITPPLGGTTQKPSRPALNSVWEAASTPPPAQEEEVVEAVPVDDDAPPPVEEPPPDSRKKPKKGPLGSAFGG